MSVHLYVALLRGINVGGNNLIKMPVLAAFFETLGFTEVRTYIQSGNVVFRADESDQAKLTSLLEAALSKNFNYGARLVTRSYEELRDIVAQAPKGFGGDLAAYRYDVLFLREPLSSSEAMRSISIKEGVDEVFAGDRVLYSSRLISRATQSHLSRLISMPIYQHMTIRNWNTTTRLLAMMEATNR